MLRTIHECQQILRFDYTSLFCLLPLDVHRLMALYVVRGVRKELQFVEARRYKKGKSAIRITHRGTVRVQPVTGMWRRTSKPNGNVVAINSDHRLYECIKGRKWRYTGILCVHHFCVTPNNACIVHTGHAVTWYTNEWKLKHELLGDIKICGLCCQSNGNIVCVSPDSIYLRTKHFDPIRSHRLYESMHDFAIDSWNHIVVLFRQTIIIYASDLSGAHKCYSHFEPFWYPSTMYIDCVGCIYVHHQPLHRRETITILA